LENLTRVSASYTVKLDSSFTALEALRSVSKGVEGEALGPSVVPKPLKNSQEKFRAFQGHLKVIIKKSSSYTEKPLTL